MAFKSFFKKQLSTVIEWKDQDNTLMFHKADTPASEIKNASKLLVSPGQGCILVYEGKIQDILLVPGMYFLETDNHPFITTFLKLRQAFESEHKMYLYFFRTAEMVNLPWGTANPVKYVDPVYQLPIQLGAHGNYSVKIAQADSFFVNIMGSADRFTTYELNDLVTGRITPILTSFLAQSGYSYKDIDAHLADMSEGTKQLMSPILSSLGLELTDFRIESSTFDTETQEKIDRIAGMTTESLSAAEVGLSYVELEKLRALRDAAKNEGGLAGAGLQVGAGLELSKSLMRQKDTIIDNGEGEDPMTQLKKLKLLLDEQIITQEEFDTKKKELLSRI